MPRWVGTIAHENVACRTTAKVFDPPGCGGRSSGKDGERGVASRKLPGKQIAVGEDVAVENSSQD